jgi:hypothetical protein
MLADRFLMPALQNTAMDLVVARYNTSGEETFPPEEKGAQLMSLIYEAKGETMVKRVTADKFVSGISSTLLEKWVPLLPLEMVADIAIAYSRQFHRLRVLRVDGWGEEFTLLASDYHVAVQNGGCMKSGN